MLLFNSILAPERLERRPRDNRPALTTHSAFSATLNETLICEILLFNSILVPERLKHAVERAQKMAENGKKGQANTQSTMGSSSNAFQTSSTE
ncbi:hypothetical protein VTO42DRAFT_4441 [Malbranchea cinnamomea]